MTKPSFMDFIVELFKRFGLKSPSFFQKLQTLGIIAVVIGFIPDALEWLDISVSGKVATYIAFAVKIAGGVTWLISKLPVQSVTDTVITKPQALPFTAQVEANIAEDKAQNPPLQFSNYGVPKNSENI